MLHLIVENIRNPPILFFVLGILAVFLKSDLELPNPLPKALSIYLLFAIGLHGGVALAKSGLSQQIALMLVVAVIMSGVLAGIAFLIARIWLSVHNAAAVGAAYGSVSAVTFLTTCNYLNQIQTPYSGYMVATLALMESPAIVVGLLCLRAATRSRGAAPLNFAHLIKESIINGSVFLLLGSFLIGYFSRESSWDKLSPFTEDIFVGALCLFLLDMGIAAAKGFHGLRESGVFAVVFAIAFPLLGAATGIIASKLLGLSEGDSLIFAVLCASASYIAVPAVMRTSVPEANPGLYVPMTLALTFPFNILLGIPLYDSVIRWIMK